jgi:cation transporter-like permease
MEQCWQKCAIDEIATIQCLECLFSDFLSIATALAGLAVFVMLLAGGFQYLTSGGDPKATESAKNTLTYAVLGLVLIIVAWFILRFIEEFTGVTVTQFEIPSPPPAP